MRLRSVIKTPSRFGDEMEGNTARAPRVPQEPRESREPREPRELRYSRRRTAPIHYVEFNPNLPPAAFPTLDNPRPPGKQNCSRSAVNKEREDEDEDDDDDYGVYTVPRTEYGEDYSYVPLRDFDNFVASNGPQNPQYAANMLVMSQASFSDLSVSDSDDGETLVLEPRPEEDPTWGDLPLSLQIEIADNMLLRWHIGKIQKVLSLSNKEVVELQRNLNKRDQDIEYENKILEEMRATQMRTLLDLDYSQLHKYSIPEKMIMSRKSWARCHKVIKKNSKMKYLLCQLGDLRLARKFLAKRGLPLSDAGDWDNDYVATPTISNDFEDLNTFTWKDPEQMQPDMLDVLTDGTITPDFQPGMSTTINPRVRSQMPRNSAQQEYNEGPERSTAAPWDKGEAWNMSGDMPPYMPASFSSESASDFPLLRRLVSLPESTIIQQQWPAQSMLPDYEVLGTQEEQATIRRMEREGQIIGERLGWNVGLAEFCTAPATRTPMMQLPVEASSSAQMSVWNDLDTAVDMEDERRLYEAMLTFTNPEAYPQEPDQSDETPSQENPWGELLKGAGAWAAADVVAEPAVQTPQRHQVALPGGQSYITPAPQCSPVPVEEEIEVTEGGGKSETTGPAKIGGPTPPPTLPENRRLRSRHRKRQSSDLGVESPSNKRPRPTPSSVGSYNLRPRPENPAKK